MINLQSLVGDYKIDGKLGKHLISHETDYSTELGENPCPYIRSTPEKPGFCKPMPAGDTLGSVEAPYRPKDNYNSLKNMTTTDWLMTALAALLMAYLFSKLFNKLIPKPKILDAREELLKKRKLQGLNLDDYEIGNPWERHKTNYGGKENGTI